MAGRFTTTLRYVAQRLRVRHLLIGGLGLFICGVALLWAAPAYVARTTPVIYRGVAEVPPTSIAIVFGAGVTRNGTPTAALADRITAGVALYQAGKVQHLLMTGDNGTNNYDEVTAMRRYAEERGVPSAAITLDYAGFRTYDSCYRAQAIFGVHEAILVTQAYHLPRALYTCAQLGVSGWGLAADALPNSRRNAYRQLLPGYIQRERFAVLVMLWQVHVTQPLPRFLGPSEPLQLNALHE